MAKYDVTMSCGHVQTVQLFGKETDRDKKIAWFEKHGLCTECYKAQKEAERAEATAKAAEKAIANNLPALTGTEKQINWALTIREKFLAEVDEHCDKCIAGLDDAQKIAENKMQCQAIKTVLANFTEARFWIDNRNSLVSQIIKQNNLKDAILAEIATLKTSAGITEESKVEETATVDEEAKIIDIAPAKFEVVVEGYVGKAIMLMQSKANKLVDGDAAAISYALSALDDNVDTVFVDFYDDANDIVKKFHGTLEDVKNILETLASAYPAEEVQTVVMSDVEDDGSNDDPDEESVLDTVGFNFDDDDDDDELVDEPEIDNAAADENQSIVLFEANKTYRGIAPDGRSETVSISRRTRCTVNVNGLKRRIYVDNGVEYIKYVNQIKVYADAVVNEGVDKVQDVEESKVESYAETAAVVEETPQVEVNTLSIAKLDAIHCQLFCADGAEDTCSTLKGDDTASLQAELDNAENEVEMVKELHRQLVAGDEAAKELLADGTIGLEIMKYNFEEGVDGGAALNFGEWDCYDVVGLKAAYRIIKRAGLNRGEYILQDDRAFHNITVYRPAIIKMCKTYGVEYKGIKSANEYDAMVETATTAEESAVAETAAVVEETPQVEVNTLSIAELDAIHCQLFCADGAEDTCSTLKGDDTASLQAELDNAENEVEMCRQDVDESERLLAYYRRMYIETIAKLAVIEDKITEYGLIHHEDKKALTDAETCAAAIRAQIDGQNYSAQKLLDAVDSVDNTVAVDTITFELQKFTGDEGEEKIEELETKFRADERDTNTELTPASTFTGFVDLDVEEDAKFDELTESLVEELSNYESEIEKLRGRIAELEDAIEETTQELDKHEGKLTQYMRNKIKFKSTREVSKNLAGAIMPVIPQHRDSVEVNLNAWILESSVLQVRINACSGEILIEYHGGWHVLLAEYNSVTKFKAAIRELAAAIKRGDKQFKFPADVQDK